jgi:outer membrane protein assembly factor BamA
VPVYGQLIKQIGRSHWYVGANYLYLQSQIERGNPIFYQPEEISSKVSRLSLLMEYDSRDNIFTPNKGLLLNTQVGAAGESIGSDYDYQLINSAAFYYLPLSHKLISGFRAEYQQVWNDVPFYLKPFINMRGIPVARYQGNVTTLLETEWRYDFVPRWSGLIFSGAGKAIQDWTDFSDAPWHGSVGVGGRYLIASKLKLRMGIDVARGPEQWAYYIVFGTSWVR